jgi:hypothetical protein
MKKKIYNINPWQFKLIKVGAKYNERYEKNEIVITEQKI